MYIYPTKMSSYYCDGFTVALYNSWRAELISILGALVFIVNNLNYVYINLYRVFITFFFFEAF